jgi:hypothetical protein
MPEPGVKTRRRPRVATLTTSRPSQGSGAAVSPPPSLALRHMRHWKRAASNHLFEYDLPTWTDLLTVDSGVATGRAGGEPPTRDSRWTGARGSSPSPSPVPTSSRPLSPSASARTRDELECREIHGASSAFCRRRLPDAEP